MPRSIASHGHAYGSGSTLCKTPISGRLSSCQDIGNGSRHLQEVGSECCDTQNLDASPIKHKAMCLVDQTLNKCYIMPGEFTPDLSCYNKYDTGRNPRTWRTPPELSFAFVHFTIHRSWKTRCLELRCIDRDGSISKRICALLPRDQGLRCCPSAGGWPVSWCSRAESLARPRHLWPASRQVWLSQSALSIE